MESTPDSSLAEYLVHHEGQVQGPFTLNFLAAMALGGVFASSAVVEQVGTGRQMPLHLACGQRLTPCPAVPAADEYDTSFAGWVRDYARPLTLAAVVVCLVVALVVWTNHNHRTISSPALPPFQPTNQDPYTSSSWPRVSVPPPPELPASYLNPSPGPGAVPPPAAPSWQTTPQMAVPTPAPPPAPVASQVYKDANGQTYSVSNADYYRLVGMKAGLDVEEKEILAKRASCDALEAEVNRDEASLNRSSQLAVDLFNEKVNRLNAMSQALQPLIDAFNFRVNSFNAELERVGRRIN